VDRREGDLLGVDVEVTGEGVDPWKLRVDFDDRNTIVSDKGDQHAFNEQGIAVAGAVFGDFNSVPVRALRRPDEFKGRRRLNIGG
jgi:hypothetical protein